MNSAFHNEGAVSLQAETDFMRQREAEYHRCVARLLAHYGEELLWAGPLRRWYILRSIRKQARRESSLDYCLF